MKRTLQFQKSVSDGWKTNKSVKPTTRIDRRTLLVSPFVSPLATGIDESEKFAANSLNNCRSIDPSRASSIEWIQNHERPPDAYSTSVDSIIDAHSEGYLVAGTTRKSGGANDAWILATDNSGQKLWQQTYGFEESAWNTFVVQLAGGGYLSVVNTGQDGMGEESEVRFFTIDSNGQRLTEETFDLNWINSLAPTRDGYAIGGATMDGGTTPWLVVFNDLKEEQWRLELPGNRQITSVVGTSDNGYLVGGDGGRYVAKVNDRGEVTWSNSFGSGAVETVVESADGSYRIAGSVIENANEKAWMASVSSSGKLRWENTYEGLPAVNGVQSEDDSVLFASPTRSGNGKVMKLGSDGSVHWCRVYQGYETGSLLATGDGKYIAVGESNNGVGLLQFQVKSEPTSGFGIAQWFSVMGGIVVSIGVAFWLYRRRNSGETPGETNNGE